MYEKSNSSLQRHFRPSNLQREGMLSWSVDDGSRTEPLSYWIDRIVQDDGE